MKKLSVLFTTLAVAATLSLAGCANTVSSTPDLPVTHTVTFVAQGKTVATQAVDDGLLAKLPETAPVNGDYEFSGWYNGEKYAFSKPVTSDLILTAKWVKVTKAKYESTVTFDSGFGDETHTGSILMTFTDTTSGQFYNYSTLSVDAENSGTFIKTSTGYTFQITESLSSYANKSVSYVVNGTTWTQDPSVDQNLYGFGNNYKSFTSVTADVTQVLID